MTDAGRRRRERQPSPGVGQGVQPHASLATCPRPSRRTGGSALVLADGLETDDERQLEACAAHGYRLRTEEQFHACLGELELVEPGLVPVNLWRPRPAEIGTIVPLRSSRVAVARKP